MADIVISYKTLEIDLFNNVETALKNINSTANVGIHLIRIKAAVERAIFDEERDAAFEGHDLWSEELRKLNNFLKRLKDKPPTHNRIKKRIEELHEVTKYFLNTRLKISGTSGKGLSELNLGSIEDLEELKMAVSHSRKIQFLETGLDDLPGVYVRSSGELILLPPHELNFDSDFGLVARSMYEREDTLAPFGIPYLPDGLRKMIRAAERQTLADKRKPKLRAGVLPELYAPIAEGGRNNTLARRAGYLLGVRKLTEAQTLEALLDINQRCCQPPLGLCEVSNIARSIAKKHHRHG